MPGIGKSVLFEHLTGDAYEIGHPHPEQPSHNEEIGKIVAPHTRIRLVTIPGQEWLDDLVKFRKFRKYNLDEEIKDLRRNCQMVQGSILEHKKPIWMLVVATKCDVYADELSSAENYYSPFAENGFASELRAFRATSESFCLPGTRPRHAPVSRISNGMG